MMKKRTSKQQAGFTIVEIIVVLGIIAIIIGLGLINFQVANDSSTTFSASRDLLLSDLRLTADKALNGERFQGQEPVGWGVYFPGGHNTYIMFADLDGDRVYDANEKFRFVKLNSDLKVYTLFGGTTNDESLESTVVFNTGDGKTYFNNTELGITSTTYLLINLLNKNDAVVNTLQITPAGTVSVANPAIKNQAQPDSIDGLIAWYKADALTGLSNGELVSLWDDSSDFNNNATQNGTARPTYITNAVNSLPVVRFNGTNNYLSISGISSLQTVFIVMKWVDPTPNYSPILGKTSSTINPPPHTATLARFWSDTNASGRVIHQTWSYAGLRDATVYNNGAQFHSSALMRDKINFQIITLIPTYALYFDNIGSNYLSYFTSADYAEIIVYDTILSTTDRQAVETYLSYKYNIPLSY